MDSEMEAAEREAMEFVASSTNNSEAWATAFTLAHLRVPRIEMIAYDSLDDVYHFKVAMVIDKALTALVATTWPGHEGGPADAAN